MHTGKKYFLLLFSFALLVSYSFSQDVSFSSSDTLRSYHIITLKDGTVLKGKIIVQDKKAIQFQDEMVGNITFRTRDVSSMEKVEPQDYYLVTMMNGTTLQGKIVNKTEKEIIMETSNIGRINVDVSKIKTIKSINPGNMQDGRYWFTTPVDAHYAVAPSAISLRPGEAYLQNTMGLFNSFDVGITSNFSCMGGIFIPLAAFIAPSISYKIRNGIHISGGLFFVDITGAPYAGAAYGLLTFGNRNRHLSVGGAYGRLEGIKKYYYLNTVERIELGLISLSGFKRLSPKYAIFSENWLTPTEGIGIFTGGLRLLGEKNTWDFGIARVSVKRSVTGSSVSLGTVSFLSYMRNL
jgi:hypothetical protein